MPFRRHNTDAPLDNLQYNTPRGNYPVTIVSDQVYYAPAATTKKTPSNFPHLYNNREGLKDAEYPLFDEMETRKKQLYEFPIKTPSERPFDYGTKASKPDKNRQGVVFQKTQKGQKAKAVDLAHPPNQSGPVRAVTNRDKQLIGVMYHPEGDMKGFEKASLGALDRQGREDLRKHAYHTTHVSRASTIPYKSW